MLKHLADFVQTLPYKVNGELRRVEASDGQTITVGSISDDPDTFYVFDTTSGGAQHLIGFLTFDKITGIASFSEKDAYHVNLMRGSAALI